MTLTDAQIAAVRQQEQRRPGFFALYKRVQQENPQWDHERLIVETKARWRPDAATTSQP